MRNVQVFTYDERGIQRHYSDTPPSDTQGPRMADSHCAVGGGSGGGPGAERPAPWRSAEGVR
jgi:hypothetical protein